jgi:hypothetical protein
MLGCSERSGICNQDDDMACYGSVGFTGGPATGSPAASIRSVPIAKLPRPDVEETSP